MKEKNKKIDRLPHPRQVGVRNDRVRVAIAMSGGVDSAVAAKILVDQGYEVVGFMMKLWSDPDYCSVPSANGSRGRENACCDAQGVLDAKKVAEMIGIPFYLLNAKEIFKKHVADYFLEEYKSLRTPNPCVVCNDKIKFGWLLDFAKKTGCDYLATGHYARIVDDSGSCQLSVVSCQNSNTTFHLLKGKDENKDQSYFLYNLNQEQLSQIMFPVGEFTKTEVRAMAKKWHLPVFEKRESQEICFIQDKDFREFLKRNIPAKYFKPGEIVDTKGNVLGKHEGLVNYTIGQRKGIEQTEGLQMTKSKLQISNKNQNPNDKKPQYVTGFDAKRNQLIVGEDSQVYKNEMRVGDIHFVQNTDNRIQITENLKVKIRYRHPAVLCHPALDAGSRNNCIDSGSPVRQAQGLSTNRRRITGRNDKLVVRFNEPQRAITPGQSAVFYLPRAGSRGDGDEVLGGGIIS